MQSHTYKIAFEDFPFEGDLMDGFITIEATRFDWEATDVAVFAGRNGEVLIDAPEAIAHAIREHFMARPSWLEAADLEHRAYFPVKSERPRLIPAYLE